MEKRLRDLIKDNRYLNPKEKDHYADYLESVSAPQYEIDTQRKLSRQRFIEEHRELPSADLMEQALQHPDNVQELTELYPLHYFYHEGDVVYIGADKYEVIAFDENAVSLRNAEFPLFGKEFSRADFEEKLRENPANDHLKTVITESQKKETPAVEKPDSITFSIGFSEHPAFYDRELNDRFTELSFALGNRLLGVLDEKQHYERLDESKGIGWYKKTDFEIHAVIGGEEFHYEGRFDIGDGEGDLIAHIRNFYEYSLSPDCPFIPEWKRQGEDYYREKMESLRFGQDVFLPFLEQHTELTPEDEKLLAEILATESDWNRKGGDKEQPEETKSHGESPEDALLKRAISCIDAYCDAEFGLDAEADYTDLSNIKIAYTTTEDGLHGIQAAADLLQYRMETYIDGVLVDYTQYDDLADFIENGLSNLYFHDLVSVTEEQLEQFYRGESREKTEEISPDLIPHAPEPIPHYTVEQTSDAFADPFIIRDNTVPEDSSDRYYDVGGVYQTFENEEEAQAYADALNRSEISKNQIAEPVTAEDNSDLIGKELMIDNRRYLIESVGKISGDVSMRDITFQNSVEFPINRVEKIGYVRRILEQEQKEAQSEEKTDITATATETDEPKRKPQGRDLKDILHSRLENAKSGAGYTALKEDIDTLFMDKDGDSLVGIASDEWLKQLADMPDDEFRKYKDNYQKGRLNAYKLLPHSTEHNNYRITDDALGVGGAKEKFRNNLSAIRLLHDLQIENRLATPEEQETLAKYVGWGGLPMAFDEKNTAWANEYKELKAELSDGEYRAVMESTLTAFYTPPVVIKAMYEALDRLGFSQGNILEPSCGTGNFLGLLPDSMEKSKLHGIEIDPISGRIAKQLYQKASIAIEGFENTKLPDSHFDVVLGNIPFGEFKVNDSRYNAQKFLIHDYFIAKALDKVRAGGVVMFITSKGTMDKASPEVRKKLITAKAVAHDSPEYEINVSALEKVIPKDLPASEISVRLGTTWIPQEDIQQFMVELLTPSSYAEGRLKVRYTAYNGDWFIENKSSDVGNVKADSTYGTKRASAYRIIEDTLNLRDTRIFDYIYDEHHNKKAVLNHKETTAAQAKQEVIKQAFQDWIWKDPERRNRLVRYYNDTFNSIRPREYDGSHITFGGISPEIKLRPHQVNAIAHILYGGNTLLAHKVGAGKTFEMVAAAQESKRLGLCQKSMFVVPNHLVGQWASEYLRLYPSANILVTTKRDFETGNRKKFCGRIATGAYDAVIIGHSQFEKIPISEERQREQLMRQLDDIERGIDDVQVSHGEQFTVKQLMKTRKAIKAKLDKLNDTKRKDSVINFEELGVDRLFIDESHFYKNLYHYTKMRNVGGIAQTEAQKSSDLFMKCRYLDEITGSRGVIFATGTPISNSMVEMYYVQRYLQYDTLVRNGLQHFDSWASTFGETVTALELSPEGTNYRAKTRFAKFYNLPELMQMFREVADIQTADMLKLPVPKVNYHNIKTKPSEIQTEMVAGLAKRAEKVRARLVKPQQDNMLKITNDGRQLALDQRLIDPMLPDDPNSKVNACVDNIYRILEEHADTKAAQLLFCDLSTPKNDGTFNVYDDMRKKLIQRGIPAEQVRFIHEATTDAQKKEMFAKVRSGEVRVLFGSTPKMGAGTNVQGRLIAIHNLDCPWRPSDVGRILRTFKIKKNVEVTDNGKDDF